MLCGRQADTAAPGNRGGVAAEGRVGWQMLDQRHGDVGFVSVRECAWVDVYASCAPLGIFTH